MSKTVGHLDRLVRIMVELGMIFQGVFVGQEPDAFWQLRVSSP